MNAALTRLAPAPTTPVALSLEARLAAVDAAMTVRLETALLALDINSAHADTVLDLADVIRVPVAIPAIPEAAHPTPIAALLQRARRRLETDGWRTGALVDAAGARCLLGAIKAEAPQGSGMDGEAAAVLLEAIRRRFSGVETVPEFNDRQLGPEMPLQILGEAADLAHNRGI